MIPTKIFLQIHDSRRLLITYWLINDFLSGHVVSFCKVSVNGVRTSVFIQTRDHHSFCPGMELFCIWTLSIRVTGETSGLSARIHELYRGCGGMLPRKIFWKLVSRKRHILHSLDRTQFNHTCILLNFSQSLVIHDSQAEVQRFMIPLPSPIATDDREQFEFLNIIR